MFLLYLALFLDARVAEFCLPSKEMSPFVVNSIIYTLIQFPE